MGKKIRKWLKFICIICAIVLIIELILISFRSKEKSIYFDGINSIVHSGNGFVVVGSNNNNGRYFEKAKITKYDESKKKIFEKIYNKGYNGVFLDVVEDSDENLIAVGSFESSESEHFEGNRVALIVKYDKDGNMIYENSFQLLCDSNYNAIVSVDDGYIVSGQSVYADMMTGSLSKGGAILAKYDKQLNLLWFHNYGDNKTAKYNDILIYNDSIYAVGVDDGNGIIAKYHEDGEFKKIIEYKDMDSFGFTSVVYLDNRIIVGGAKKELSTNKTDAILLRYQLDLELDKEVVYEGSDIERFNKIITDNHNNVIVVGTAALLNKDKNNKSVNAFAHDGIIGKYDKNLVKVNVVKYGDERDDYFTDVIVSEDNYLVLGYSSYEDGSYLSKFITYSDALKMLGVE